MGLVAATVAWLSVDKTVTLQVDGASRQVRTASRDVSGVLAGASIAIGPHDIVAPDPAAPVHNGDTVIVRYGRLVHLVVDGVPIDQWVNAPTVEAALSQLGYSSGSYSSVSRDTRLSIDPTNIDVRTPKNISVAVDGATVPLVTTEATVADALTAGGIAVGPDDIVSVPPTSPVQDGQEITVNRVTFTEVVDRVDVPFDTQRTDDPTLAAGRTVVDTLGANGAADVTYRVTLVDGVESARAAVSQADVTAPVTQVERVGTKAPAAAAPVASPPASSSSDGSAPTGSSGSSGPSGSGSSGGGSVPSSAPPAPASSGDNSPAGAQATAQSMLADRGWGADQFSCLVSLWNKESGWRVGASNPSGAYGIPQALPGSKMGAYGSDWQTNAATQIAWGLSYIASRYGTPCGAWSSWQSQGWY
ncbi:MAG: ubiquitin-like domain-containing protein [Frankiaceae bacterium]|nr:ubiquitin-like domain-containing protein [Frankiaceae bacterium]